MVTLDKRHPLPHPARTMSVPKTLHKQLAKIGSKGGKATAASPRRSGFTPDTARQASQRRWSGHPAVEKARVSLHAAIKRVVAKREAGK